MKTSIAKLLAAACFSTAFVTGTASAQILRVESVSVDSVWNSDSSWYDGNGILQQRTSRDCKVSFIPQGEGMARMFIALSIDSGKTWAPSPNPLSVMNNALSSTFITGQKATLMVRVLGGDRPGVAFKMTARQAAPKLAGNPKTTVLGSATAALTPGANVSVVLSVRLAGVSGSDGFCTISKVYWDAFGDGTIDDSTTGVDELTWTWLTPVPAGASGQKRGVIARAIDKNNLWSAPETLAVQFGLQKVMVMKDIPAGIFDMGETGIATPVHQVTLSAFKMQETEVTQEQYLAVMGSNPSRYITGTDAPLRPVEQVSWYDAVRYCNTLSLLSDLTVVYDTLTWRTDMSKSGYRLPTEAEWEYACRGGTTTTYWWGADTNGMGARAWSTYNSGNTTHPVATKMANAYGLHDMAGNVWEWNNDWYGAYWPEAVTNPTGSTGSGYRVLRGGCWDNDETDLRSARRNSDRTPNYWYRTVGFRVVLPAR
jgi:formylglycine-generating enzyme required for sulfatase activity